MCFSLVASLYQESSIHKRKRIHGTRSSKLFDLFMIDMQALNSRKVSKSWSSIVTTGKTLDLAKMMYYNNIYYIHMTTVCFYVYRFQRRQYTTAARYQWVLEKENWISGSTGCWIFVSKRFSCWISISSVPLHSIHKTWIRSFLHPWAVSISILWLLCKLI